MTQDLPATPVENAERLLRVVEPLARVCAGEVVFLVDGDLTLTRDDTSRVMLALASIDHIAIKQRFQQDGYVFGAFRYHAERHLEIDEETFHRLACVVADGATLHEGAVEFLSGAARRGRVFIVSAGIPRIWSALLRRHSVSGIEVIGGIEPSLPYVFGRSEKGVVAALFRRHGATLVGMGDSDVDTEMLLQCHHAVVVVNHRQNADLLPRMVGHASLWQVVPQGIPHPDIRRVSFAEAALLGESSPDASTEAHACP